MRPDGKRRGQPNGKQCLGKAVPWVDYFGPGDRKTIGVAIMDHSANPRHPSYWHTRAYGSFAANIFGVRDFTGDKTKDGSNRCWKSGCVGYRIVIHPGRFPNWWQRVAQSATHLGEVTAKVMRGNPSRNPTKNVPVAIDVPT
jgi:hypothetical protein